jgi:hypothetical protein
MVLLTLCLGLPVSSFGAKYHAPPSLSATATLSSRGAKLGSKVELVVTVRHAIHPVISSVDRPVSLKMHSLSKPQLLQTGEGGVWLFRYQITPTQVGEFEIPPISVTDDSLRVETAPLPLRVSLKGEPPVLTAGELSRVLSLPMSLGEEVLKSYPPIPPKPDPSPTPRDDRPFVKRAASTCCKAFKDFWNFSGGR